MNWFPWGLGIIGGLVALASAAAVVRGLWLFLASSGWPVATGTVTNVQVAVINSDSRSARFHATVEFQTSAGEARRAIAPYFSFLGTSPAVGAPIAVRYAPDTAGRVVIDTLASRGLPEVVGGVLACGVALYIVTIATSMPF